MKDRAQKIHLVGAEGKTACGRRGGWRTNAANKLTCKLCVRILESKTRQCRGCQRVGQGSLCRACLRYRERHGPDARRGGELRSYYRIDEQTLREWHQAHLEGKTMSALARDAGVCQNKIRYQWKRIGLRTLKLNNAAARQALFPKHPQAHKTSKTVTPHEGSLLQAIQSLTGKRLTAQALVPHCDFAGPSAVDMALRRLQKRGFLQKNGQDISLTTKALHYVVQPPPRQRMEDVYREHMRARDLAVAAGVSKGLASEWIKTRKEKAK